MPTKSAFECFRGEDVVWPFDVDEDIAGWTLALVVSDQVADATPLLTLPVTVTDPATGRCEATLTAAQTGALSPGPYVWELARTNAGSVAVLAFGLLTITPRVVAP